MKEDRDTAELDWWTVVEVKLDLIGGTSIHHLLHAHIWCCNQKRIMGPSHCFHGNWMFGECYVGKVKVHW